MFTILYFIFGNNYYELTCYVENSVDTDQLASEFRSQLIWIYTVFIVYVWFHTIFKEFICTVWWLRSGFVHYLFLNMGQV